MTAAKATYIQQGENIQVTVTEDKGYHEVVPLGDSAIAILLEKVNANQSGTATTKGVFELPATSGSAIAVGDQLYWDDTNQQLTLASSGNTKAGIAIEPMGSSGTKTKVKIG